MYKVNLDALNAAEASGEQTKIDAAKEKFDNFEKAIEKYQNSLGIYNDETEKLVDMEYELEDHPLLEITETLEYNLGLVEDQVAMLEYEFEQLSDPIDDAANAIANLGQQADLAKRKADHYKQALMDSLSIDGLDAEQILAGNLDGLDLTADQADKLREYRDALLEANQTLSEMGDTVHEKVVEAFEAMNEEMERYSNKIERNNSLLEHYRNVIDLVGKDTLGISDEVMKNLADAQAAGALNAVEVAKSTLDMNKSALENARREFADLEGQLSEEDKKRWEETINTLEEQVGDSQEALADAFEGALEAAAEAFDRAVEEATKTFKDAMAGLAGSADDMQRKFDQQKDVSSRYLADYQKIYELSKLSRQLDASMDDTDSIRGKQRLRDLQEEILAMQESGAEVTQYEVDELRARYDLRLAEIALEEAQNAKSQVRMSRDAEGNWGYVYTADEKAVGQAQQAYEDKLYAYQNTTQKYIDEVESAMLGLPGEMADAIAELDRAAYSSEEEYLGAIDEIRQFYADKYAYYADNMNKALKNSETFYESDWQAYSAKTGYKMSLDQDWRDQFNETTLAQVTGYSSAEDALAAFNLNAQGYLATLGQAYTDWYNTVNTAFTNSGTSMTEYASLVSTKTEEIKSANDATAKTASDMAEDHKNAFKKIVDEAGAWSAQYSLKIKTWVDENTKLATSINTILANYQGIVDNKDTIIGAFNEINKAASTDINNGGDGNDDDDDDDSNKGGSSSKITYYGTELQTNDFSTYDIDKKEVLGISYDTTRKVKGRYAVKISTISGVKDGFMSESELKNSGAALHETHLEYSNPQKPIYLMKPGLANLMTYNEGQKQYEKAELDQNVQLASQGITKIGDTDYLTFRYKGKVLYYQASEASKHPDMQYLDFGYQDLDLYPYDTGGYTGSWDSSGRLAVLHQKELVLNASDTENFLSAVNILRDITSVIDLNAAAQYGHLRSAYSAAIAHPMQQTVEQEVTIHAEFPNATNHSEIEEAFNSLLNRASQFANRKN